MSVEVKTSGSQFEAAAPRPLFQTRPAVVSTAYRNSYAATGDGQRFLVNTAVTEASSPPITVVVNWTAALQK